MCEFQKAKVSLIANFRYLKAVLEIVFRMFKAELCDLVKLISKI